MERQTTPSIAGQTSLHKSLSPQTEKFRIAIKTTVPQSPVPQSVGFIFWVFGSAQNTQLWCVFHKYRVADAGCRRFSRLRLPKKRVGSSSVAVRDLFCSRPIGARLSRTVPRLLIGNWFRMEYAGNEACFPKAFYNGLMCGGVRRKWSMAALMDFAIRVIVLPRKRVRKLETNIQFFLCHFSYWFWNLVAPGLASHSVKVNIFLLHNLHECSTVKF